MTVGAVSGRIGSSVRATLRLLHRLRRRVLTPRAVRGVFRRHFGHHPLWIRTIQPIHATPTGIVYLVGLPGRTCIFKAALYEPGTIGTEAWVYERIGERGVPAPRVLAVDTTGTTFPTPYMILEAVTGRPLSASSLQGTQREKLLQKSGELLRRIHSMALDGYGPLDELLYLRTGLVRGLHDEWRPTALRRLHWGLPYLERYGLLDRSEVAAIPRFLDRHQTILDARWARCLLHGDFHTRHVFVEPGAASIAAIIDFGGREAGDPAWDLGRFALREREDLEHLLKGYESDARERRLLRERIPVYSFLHAFSDVRNYHKRGQNEKARERLRLIRTSLHSETRAPIRNPLS